VTDENLSKAYLLEIAYGAKAPIDENYDRITRLFRQALGVPSLAGIELSELNSVFESDSDLQQLKYKRAFGKVLGSKRDFVIMKGQVG